ncbi:MAG: hypothetical protein IMZ43_09545 [Thermoplasmata archaeon]|nr:hypothetical protein [Thermoplasmata archaeon]
MVMLGETILLGASPICPDCKKRAKRDIYHTPAGYYVGTYCDCGPYSRESTYYPSEGLARAALQNGDFGR